MIEDKYVPDMETKNIKGGFARLYFDMDLFLYKVITYSNGVEKIREILSPSKALNVYKALK